MEIVGLGAMNMDHLFQVDEVVADGEQLVTGPALLPGGSAANTTYGLAKLGVKTGFVGAVGMDEEGKGLVKDLETVGVDTSQVISKQGVGTGSALCFSDRLGRRALYVSPGANNLLSSRDVSLAYLNRAQLVHFSSFADDAQFDLQLDLVKNIGSSVKVSLAPGMLYATKRLEALAPLLVRSHIVFVNRGEIEELTGKDFRAGAGECLNLGCQVVVVTLGQGVILDGARAITGYIRDTEMEYEVEPQREGPEAELETTGAGDAFAAGFLFGFIKGKEIEECGLLGDIVAGFAINEMGARKGLPSLAQLSQRYLECSGRHL